jgi:hypothetical protein
MQGMLIPIEILVALFAAFVTFLSAVVSFAFYVVFNYVGGVRTEAKEAREKAEKKSEEADIRLNERQDRIGASLEKAKDKSTDNDKQLFMKTEKMSIQDAYYRGKGEE